MKTAKSCRRNSRTMLLSCLCAIPLLLSSWAAADDYRIGRPFNDVQPQTETRTLLAQGRQCERRQGPFATQDTAWQRWRQARGQGLAVRQSVFPCYGSHGTRGYCFNVFHPC